MKKLVMKRIVNIILMVLCLGLIISCNDFIDVVPDNVATLDQAFRTRSTAERFLFTCYSYMPDQGSLSGNPAFAAGDEFWLPSGNDTPSWQIARGNQRVVDPYSNFWQGTQGGKDLYEGIRQCNIFLDNIDQVPDLNDLERRRWIAEVKFLKAYYHFWLVRMYGPIVLIKENLPVSAGPDEVNVPRSSVDECFAYIVQLLNEAAPDLPDRIQNEVSELGRVTRLIDLSLKAKVLVTAASPLFNGNQDYKGYTGPDGKELFNTDFEATKWDSAAAAAKKAIDLAESLGYKLYEFNPQFSQYELSDTTQTKMSIRNSVTEKWNSEIIWGNTNNMADYIQRVSTPRGLDPSLIGTFVSGLMGPSLRIAEMFYSNHGVPITEDKTWDYTSRYDVKMAGENERYNLEKGYTTAKLHFNREPRFYADVGFDGGIWYGQGHYDDNSSDLFFVSNRKGDPAAIHNPAYYSVTGYWPKKLVSYNNVIGSTSYTVEPYPWPVMRLADLYLLYAEAQNESSGPGQEVYKYINKIRARAGIPTVQDAWSTYSTNPDEYTTKDGLRAIIHRERLIELAFEGHRFWDLRRWKEATDPMNNPIKGWDLDQASAEGYYRPRAIYDLQFRTRDYLWPLNENIILSNTNVTQNPGW